MKRIAAIASLIALSTGAVQAKAPIAENAHISGSILAAAIGDEIRKNCPSIEARKIVFFFKANRLKQYARDKGYSEEEIEAYLDSEAEKKKMEVRRDAYLEQNGVRPGDAESYCKLGREEIAKGSLTGSLLRSD